MNPLVLAAALLLSQPASAGPKLAFGSDGPYKGCTAAQKAAVETAADEAGRRVWKAKMTCAGIGPAIDDRAELRLEAGRRRCEALDEKLMGKNDADVSYYVTSMYDRLTGHRDIRCAKADDEECQMRSGYYRREERDAEGKVKPGPLPIWVCPNFFRESGPEGRVRTLVHESAHAAGISESSARESYCIVFTCDDSCGKEEGQGWRVADNWSQLVHCVSGQEPDRPDRISGADAGGKPPKDEKPSRR